ncbi:MAG TPA: radical SAM protein [Candidatus Bathyarchaeia archaeon]|nr:radical SAM protein [Candidatus Bathyarchaeia archaeon]
MSTEQDVPEKIRVSVGSAIVLGLLKGKLDAPPTTIYMLTYREGKCLANCGFCPQARTSSSRADMLARVTWPPFQTTQVIEKIASSAERGTVKRVCIQALNYPTVHKDLTHLTRLIHSSSNVPISLSCPPFTKAQFKELAEARADRISIALDAATEQLFNKVKGAETQSPYHWKQQHQALKEAVEIFGKNQVYTHLIVGLGETEKEIIHAIQQCTDSGVYPSLFAFTPISGTSLENMHQPPIETYRRIQLARHLIIHGKTRYENMKFDPEQRIKDFGIPKTQLHQVIQEGTPFCTSGCPECNRPYYNERPGGPMYNFPRQPLPDEVNEITRQLNEG